MKRVAFRPATAADFAVLFDRPIPHRVRAIAAELDGALLGVGGITFRPEGVFAFAQFTAAFKLYPAAVHRAGIAGMALIRDAGVATVIAEAQPDNPAAERWLRRFGFEPEGAVFVWRRPSNE